MSHTPGTEELAGAVLVDRERRIAEEKMHSAAAAARSDSLRKGGPSSLVSLFSVSSPPFRGSPSTTRIPE